MSENRTTVILAGASAVLALLAWLTAPKVSIPSELADRGQALFEGFDDPNAARSLEVVEYDEPRGVARPFKVQNRDGRWTIPSHHDYPADGQERLAGIAAALITLRKDDFASDSASDHERCGVLDPLDPTLPAIGGRGTRVTVRGERDQLLADVIVGRPVEGRKGFRYVRRPGQNRVYVSRVERLEVSTAFADWIERDVLQLEGEEVDAINLRQYSVDERTRRVSPGEVLLLQRPASSRWALSGTAAGVNENAVEGLLERLADLRITGVLPKPAGITETLSRAVATGTLAPGDQEDLARKGFYLVPGGQLLSNEGEVVLRTRSGLFYTLRFGEVAPGQDGAKDAAENRYLFIMVDHDPDSAATPARAADGARKAAALRARFAPWYYVISGEGFTGLRVRRRDLVTG